MKYSFNGRELDIGARTLSGSDGIEVHIEPQVYDLVRYLAENRGRVVDKDVALRDTTEALRNPAAEIARLRATLEAGHPD